MPTFTKKERLCNKKTISELYASNKKLLVYPLSVHWLVQPNGQQPSPLQVVIVAPKKKLHNAVDRNRTKRLIRECYRTRKQQIADILQQRGMQLALSINYIHNTPPDFKHLQHTFDKLFESLTNELSND